MVTVICVTSEVCLAVVVLSADTDHLGLRRSLSGPMVVWLLVKWLLAPRGCGSSWSFPHSDPQSAVLDLVVKKHSSPAKSLFGGRSHFQARCFTHSFLGFLPIKLYNPGPRDSWINLVFPAWCARVMSDASAGCSGLAQRHRFGPALWLRQYSCCQKAPFTREKLC